MKSTITEREQKQQTLSARLSGETSTDTWYVLDCIYLRFGYICDIKQTCDGHVKQTNGQLKDYCVAKFELGLT